MGLKCEARILQIYKTFRMRPNRSKSPPSRWTRTVTWPMRASYQKRGGRGGWGAERRAGRPRPKPAAEPPDRDRSNVRQQTPVMGEGTLPRSPSPERGPNTQTVRIGRVQITHDEQLHIPASYASPLRGEGTKHPMIINLTGTQQTHQNMIINHY